MGAGKLFEVETTRNFDRRIEINDVWDEARSSYLSGDMVLPFFDFIFSKMPSGLIVVGPSTEGYNCHAYSMGYVDGEKLETYLLLEGDSPAPGDIALYYDTKKKPGDDLVHSGILQKNGMIMSKWGTSPTFIHNFPDILTDYGDIMRFARIPDEVLGEWRTTYIEDHPDSNIPTIYDFEKMVKHHKNYIYFVYNSGKLTA